MSYEIMVKDLAEQPVMTIRTRTSMADIANEIGRGYGEIFGYLAETGTECVCAPMAIYHGPEFSDDNIDLELAVPVRELLEPKGRVEGRVMQAARAVTTTHIGPYGCLPAAYEAVMRYMKENDLKPADSMWEIYFTDPATVPDESQHQTEVVWPIAP